MAVRGGTKSMSGKRVWVVGTDIGGTFTDVIGVNLETGEQRIRKVASTPPNFFDGVINGLARAGIRGEETLSFRHGATVSTNAILERKGVKTALMPSRPGEFHPEPLTDPDVTLSCHPARATARRLPPSVENLSSSRYRLALSQRR